MEDVRDVEEEFRDEEEDDNEVPLEPFNLQRERQEGYFDEGGHYVENKKDNDEDRDPWLTSDEGTNQMVIHLIKKPQRLLGPQGTGKHSEPHLRVYLKVGSMRMWGRQLIPSASLLQLLGHITAFSLR